MTSLDKYIIVIGQVKESVRYVLKDLYPLEVILYITDTEDLKDLNIPKRQIKKMINLT